MNDLPTPTGNNPTPPSSLISSGIEGKEKEAGLTSAESAVRPVGQEVEVSPEVISAGVKVQPTTIPIPPQVQQMGVKPAGQNVPAGAPAVTLPLSDDQIARGLKQSIWSSWHWLAQWCVRKIKQLHRKLTRVRQ